MTQSSLTDLPLQPQRVLTVAEVNALLKTVLEEAIPQVVFEGEISEIKAGKTGHLYFTIKDADAQASAVMWAGVARTVGFKIVPGLSVRCIARPTVYQPRGSLQLVVNRMEQAGLGALQKKFLQLKAKLEAEGLFDKTRKRSLPFLPKAVGIVSSAQGAVIHDIIHRVQDRFPAVQLYLIDVRVQGEGAASQVAAAVQEFNKQNIVDVIIVARGGGSLEDLWAFNEEVVVRAVFGSKIVVVSAVGHETDITLCDLAADVRAPTPTAAAEIVVPRRDDLVAMIDQWWHRLKDTERWLQPKAQQLDELESRLDRRVELAFENARLTLGTAEQQLKRLKPDAVLRAARERLDGIGLRLMSSTERIILQRRGRFELLQGKLEAVSPMKVLTRGYAMVRRGAKVMRTATEIEVGQHIEVTFADGEISAAVEKVRSDGNKTSNT